MIRLTAIAIALLGAGCWQSEKMYLGAAPDADGDSDSDADVDSDTDVDSDSDVGTDTGMDDVPSYAWHTFHGSGMGDTCRAIAATEAGGVIVAGLSNDGWDGPGGEAAHNSHGAGDDAVVLELAEGGEYLWHAFYGGPGDDIANAVANDVPAGVIYVAGTSIAAWDGPSGEAPRHGFAVHPEPSEAGDGFALALDAGGGYRWHTFFGGGRYDEATAAAAPPTGGGVVIAGRSDGIWDGPAGEPPLHTADEQSTAAFVVALDEAGGYLWHTFYNVQGGSWYGNVALAIAPGGEIFVAAPAFDAWDGPDGEPPLEPFHGGSDVVVIGLSPAGGYLWHAFHGAELGLELPLGIAANEDGAVAVTGTVGDPGDPWVGPNGEEPTAGPGAQFVAAFDADGGYRWHGFFGPGGSPSPFRGGGIAAAGSDVFLVAADAYDPWVGPIAEAPLHPHSGYLDALLFAVSSAGEFLWYGFWGSEDNDAACAVAPGPWSSVYFAETSVQGFSVGGHAPQRAHSGGADLAIVKLGE